MTLPATADFTGSNFANLPANWTVQNGAFYIYSNAAVPAASNAECCAYWNADSFPADQYSQATATVITHNYYAIGLAVRVATSTADTYYGYYWLQGSAILYKMISGTWSQIGSEQSAPTAGAIVRLEVSGTTLTVKYGSTTIMTETDTSISSGAAGISGWSQGVENRIDGWEGGSLGSTTHDLTATAITTTPVLGTPAVGQKHALTASAITTTPVIGTPALGQAHALTASPVTAGAPTLGTPAIGQAHALTATGLATTPVIGTPALGQVHNLTATGIAITPEVGSPALGQVHALTATAITITPVLGTPALGGSGTHDLTADDITAGTPALGSPALGQVHALTATAITIPAPVIGSPALGQAHALAADGITASAPVLGSPAIGQVHAMTAVGLEVAPILGTPTLGQIHVLAVVAWAAGTPILGTPALHILTASTTPDSRTCVVLADDRIVFIPGENRVTSILFDDRVHPVGD